MSQRAEMGALAGLRGLAAVLAAAAVVVVVLAVVAYSYQDQAPRITAAEQTPNQSLPKGDGVNLIRQSEQFSVPRWQPEGATVEPGSAISRDRAPEDGPQTSEISPAGEVERAERLVESSSDGSHRLLLTVVGLKSEAIHTFSIFVRPAGRSAIMLEGRDNPTKNYGRIEFNLPDRTVLSRYKDVKDAGIEPLADNWYRCWLSIFYATARAEITVGLVNHENSRSYQGDGRSGLELWGAQFELGRLGPHMTILAGSSSAPSDPASAASSAAGGNAR